MLVGSNEKVAPGSVLDLTQERDRATKLKIDLHPVFLPVIRSNSLSGLFHSCSAIDGDHLCCSRALPILAIGPQQGHSKKDKGCDNSDQCLHLAKQG